MAATDRPLRLIVDQGIYDQPIIKPFAKIARAIPVSARSHPRDMIRSFREASDALHAGEVVVIFVEDQAPRRAFERIVKTIEVPIIPVSLDNISGSVVRIEKGSLSWKFPRRLAYPVNIRFGKPILRAPSIVATPGVGPSF